MEMHPFHRDFRLSLQQGANPQNVNLILEVKKVIFEARAPQVSLLIPVPIGR